MKPSEKSVKVNYYFPFGKSCGRVEALWVNVAFNIPFPFCSWAKAPLLFLVRAPKAKYSSKVYK